MFENIGYFFKRMVKAEQKEIGSKDAAKERLHLVLMQDRANVSADFLELMKQEIIDVIKKYIVVDDSAIDVRLTNQSNDDGTTGAPALYANIPIVNIKNEMIAEKVKEFNGVDFNKEMGIPNKSYNKKEEDIKEISNSDKVEKEKEKESQENEISDNKISESESVNEVDEVEKNDEEDLEESDEDVTFDDLLKAAEEEEKQKEEPKVENLEKNVKEVEKSSKKAKKKSE